MLLLQILLLLLLLLLLSLLLLLLLLLFNIGNVFARFFYVVLDKTSGVKNHGSFKQRDGRLNFVFNIILPCFSVVRRSFWQILDLQLLEDHPSHSYQTTRRPVTEEKAQIVENVTCYGLNGTHLVKSENLESYNEIPNFESKAKTMQ